MKKINGNVQNPGNGIHKVYNFICEQYLHELLNIKLSYRIRGIIRVF